MIGPRELATVERKSAKEAVRTPLVLSKTSPALRPARAALPWGSTSTTVHVPAWVPEALEAERILKPSFWDWGAAKEGWNCWGCWKATCWKAGTEGMP